jgi:hypothetical protein
VVDVDHHTGESTLDEEITISPEMTTAGVAVLTGESLDHEAKVNAIYRTMRQSKQDRKVAKANIAKEDTPGTPERNRKKAKEGTSTRTESPPLGEENAGTGQHY